MHIRRRALGCLMAFLVALASVTTGYLSSTSANAAKASTKDYIVVLKDNTSPNYVGAFAKSAADLEGVVVKRTWRHALKGFQARLTPAAKQRLEADPHVAFVTPNRTVSLPPIMKQNGATVDQEIPVGIDRIEADLSSTKPGDGTGAVNVPVAVVDTGVDKTNPDLNVVGGVNCTTSDSTAYQDGHGHGTHVSGTIAAKDDGVGVVGVAPGAPIYGVKVLNDGGSGTYANVICGLDWVAATGAAKVANMSLGGSGSSDGNCGWTNKDAMHVAICKLTSAGTLVVVAAGNSNADESKHTPSAYEEALTVTAMADFDGKPGGAGTATCRTNPDDAPASFSNYTRKAHVKEKTTIAAPGVCVLSLLPGGKMASWSGTSMATPHVAGTAALCMSNAECGKLRPSLLLQKLVADATMQPASYGFKGDAHQTPTPDLPYYGYLVHAGGY